MDQVNVVFILPNGERKTVTANSGENLLEIAHDNRVDLEGACEGSVACSTCHVVVDAKWFTKLDEATDNEEDMLDFAFGLTPTSRLGCQIKVTKELSGIEVRLPGQTRNMQLEKMQK